MVGDIPVDNETPEACGDFVILSRGFTSTVFEDAHRDRVYVHPLNVSKYKSHQPYKFQYNHLRDDEILSMDRNKNPSQIQRYVPVKEDQIEIDITTVIL